MKRKIFKLLSCVVMCTCFIGNFIGCNESKEEKNNINLWLNTTEDEGNEIKNLAESWSEQNGIEVNVVINQNNTEGSVDEYLKSTQNGVSPQMKLSPDIEFGLSHEYLEKLIKLNLAEEVPSDLIDFNNYVSKDLIESVTVDNKKYAYPISQECSALYYNKDLINKVPDTMEDLVKDGKTKGFVYDINNFYISYAFISAGGGYVFKNNNGAFDRNDIGLNNKGAVEGYKFLQDLIQKDNLMAAEVNDNVAESSFYNGKSAYYIGEAKKLKMIENTSNLNFGVMPIPKLNGNVVKPFKSVKVALVNPESIKKEECYKLLKYLIENSKETLMSKGNRLPVFKDALESENFKKDEYLQGFYLQAQNAEIMPNIVVTETMWTPAATNFILLITGQITPEECGENIVKQIKESIQILKQ